jgi:hypothetical protein
MGRKGIIRGQVQRQPVGIVARRLDADLAGLEGQFAAAVGAVAQEGVQIREREEFLIIGASLPLARHRADKLTAKGIDFPAADRVDGGYGGRGEQGGHGAELLERCE